MSNTVTVHVEQTDEGFWTYIRRSAGELPSTSLQHILQWVVEQLNFGHFHFEKQDDSNGDIVSLTIGKAAAQGTASADEAVEDSARRLFAVNINGVLAKARESGVTPEHAYVSKAAAQQATDWSYRNTELTPRMNSIYWINAWWRSRTPSGGPLTGFSTVTILPRFARNTRRHAQPCGTHLLRIVRT